MSTRRRIFGDNKVVNTVALFHFENNSESEGIYKDGIYWSVPLFTAGKFSFAARFQNYPIVFNSKNWFWNLINSGEYTIELWYNCSNRSSTHSFISDDITGDTSGFNFYLGYNLILFGNFGNTVSISATNLLIGWNHIAAVSIGGIIKIYINGVQMASTSTKPQQRTHKLCIGGRDGTTDKMIGGIIDEFRISNIARYSGNFTLPLAPFKED